MDELDEIRERIAQHTDEQRTVWLHELRSRYSVWMFIAGVFAVLVMVTAVLAKSVLFGVVAAFLCLFAWNRRTERERVERWLSRPTPENQQERIIWARIFYDEIRHPPVWLRITDWISAITAVALVGTVSVVVVATSDFWMRLLYGLIYFLAALLVLLWLLARQRFARELKARIALSGQKWNELT
jgi:Flp pilus assembly protein TadB